MTDLATTTINGLAGCPIELLTIMFQNPHLDLDDRSNLSMTNRHLYNAGTEIIPNHAYVVQTPQGTTTTRHESPHSTRSTTRATVLLEANDQGNVPIATARTLTRVQALPASGEVTEFQVEYIGSRVAKLHEFLSCGLRDTLSVQDVPTLFTFRPSNLFYFRGPPATTSSADQPRVYLGPVKGTADENWPDLREVILGTILNPDDGSWTGTGVVLVWDKGVNDTDGVGKEELLHDVCAWARAYAEMREEGSDAERVRDVESDVRGSLDVRSYGESIGAGSWPGMAEVEADGIRASAGKAESRRKKKSSA